MTNDTLTSPAEQVDFSPTDIREYFRKVVNDSAGDVQTPEEARKSVDGFVGIWKELHCSLRWKHPVEAVDFVHRIVAGL